MEHITENPKDSVRRDDRIGTSNHDGGKIMNYEIGDRITYRNFGGQFITGVVESKEADIKNGRPGFDLDTGVWGYDDQIVSITRKVPRN